MSKWVSPSGTTKEFADTPANEAALLAAGYVKAKPAAKKAPAKKKAAKKG